MSNKLNAADYLLFLLDADERAPINGAIRLMKMMFLFNQEIMPAISQKGGSVGELPRFFAYFFISVMYIAFYKYHNLIKFAIFNLWVQ